MFLTLPTKKNSESKQFTVESPLEQKGVLQDAETRFEFLSSVDSLELWQARPRTGRTHQIRRHAASIELAILGDDTYGGASFAQICLHCARLEFPNGLVFESEPPAIFSNPGLSRLDDFNVIQTAIDRRWRLFGREGVYRILHAKDDVHLQMNIDQLGERLLISCYRDEWSESDLQLVAALTKLTRKPIDVRMMHDRGRDPLQKSWVKDAARVAAPDAVTSAMRWRAREASLEFEFRSDTGQSFGLFLDQRTQRNWVYQNSKGRRVLNLFAYTCGFSVAAAKGGASQIVSVDTSKSVLAWAKRNFEINGLSVGDREGQTAGSASSSVPLFLCRDGLHYLDSMAKKGVKYDVIICDPPSFSRGEKGVFRIESSLKALLTLCLVCLEKNGQLFFSTNSERLSVEDIQLSVNDVAAALKVRDLVCRPILPALDFELPGEVSSLKSFLIQISTLSSAEF
jgi:23S rRNA (cytosine1962-C5)-methyltransferase